MHAREDVPISAFIRNLARPLVAMYVCARHSAELPFLAGLLHVTQYMRRRQRSHIKEHTAAAMDALQRSIDDSRGCWSPCAAHVVLAAARYVVTYHHAVLFWYQRLVGMLLA